MITRRLATLACLLTCTLALAQEKGYWRASSKTATSITGDIAFSDTKVNINFTNFTIAQLLTIGPTQAAAVFSDLAAEYGTEDHPAYDEWFYGLPYEKPEGFRRSSPIVPAIRTLPA